jgi:ferrous iron transport protein A
MQKCIRVAATVILKAITRYASITILCFVGVSTKIYSQKYDLIGRTWYPMSKEAVITERDPSRATIALSTLADQAWGVIESLEMVAEVQNQLMHMGFMPGAPVQALRRAPAGDPTVYAIDGSEVALRRETASLIFVVPGEPKPDPIAGPGEPAA